MIFVCKYCKYVCIGHFDPFATLDVPGDMEETYSTWIHLMPRLSSVFAKLIAMRTIGMNYASGFQGP